MVRIRRSKSWLSALLLVLTLAGCDDGTRLCPASSVSSPLSSAPRNGAQMGGMAITSGGISYGDNVVEAAASRGFGVVRIYIILDAPGSGMSDSQRSALSSTLNAVRSSGVLTAFLRFYYATPLIWKSEASQKVSSISADIEQARSLVSQYLDVIPFIQAGFLGPWGEWWDGDLEGADFGTDAELRTLKTGVVDALKAAFPSVFIQLRMPRDIATYYPDDPQIGWHNDSILAGSDDGGTFHPSKRTALWPDGNSGAQRQWIKDRNRRLYIANSGESSENTPAVDCNVLLDYLFEYNIRVYNAAWPSTITACDEDIKAKLFWQGPLEPDSGGSTGRGTELGCWATDQRPWQLCDPAGCPDATRCRRSPDDPACEMYRAPSCTGSWPPPGYPGEETLPSGGTGGTGGIAGSGGIVGSGGSGATAATGGSTSSGGTTDVQPGAGAMPNSMPPEDSSGGMAGTPSVNSNRSCP